MVIMNKKQDKSISFEEHLLEKKKSYKKRLISKISFVGIIFALLFIYLFTPLSHVNKYKLSGNLNLTDDDILEICHIDRETSLFLINENKCLELLENHPLIKSAKINNNVFGFKVEIEEITPVLKDMVGNYYFNDGTIKDEAFMNATSIPDHFVDICNELPILLDATNVNDVDIELFANIYFSLSNEFKDKIKYFKIYDNGNIGFFYQEDFNYEVVLSLPSNFESYDDLSYALDKEAQKRYENEFFNKADELLSLKNYQNQSTSFEYYSILVKIEYKFGSKTPSYTVNPNN